MSAPDVSLKANVPARATVARVLPFAIYIVFLFAAPLLRAALGDAGSLDLRWLYALQIGCVVLALAWFRHEYHELLDTPWRGVQVLFAVFIGTLVFVLWISLDADWMTLGKSAGFDPSRSDGQWHWGLIAVRLVGASVVVPVMEELFWRSFVMRWMAAPNFLRVEPARVGLRALLISSLAFGFEHHLWLAGIVAGIAYGLLYSRTGNLWTAVIAHAVTNAVLGAWILYTRAWHFW